MVYNSATPPTDPAQLLLWQKWNKHVYATIYLLVSSNEHPVIVQVSIGSNALPFLNVVSNHLSLHSKFYNIMHDPSKPITKFINTIWSISHQLSAIKHPLHDTEITDMILLCLHETFFSCLLALITCKEEPTPTEIITAIKEHEAHMVITNHLPTRTHGSSDDGSQVVYFAGKQWKQGGGKKVNTEGRDQLGKLKRARWCLLAL